MVKTILTNEPLQEEFYKANEEMFHGDMVSIRDLTPSDYDIDKSARCLNTSRIRHQLLEGHACDKFLSFRITPFILSNLYPKNKDGTLTERSAHLGDGPSAARRTKDPQ